MPNFTQEPYIPPKTSLLPSPKFKPAIPYLVVIVVLYLVYFFLPTRLTAFIPNPFGKKAVITVIGTGTIEATPDSAVFAVTVADTDSSSKGAINKAKQRVDRLTRALKLKGVTDQDIRISSYNVKPARVGETTIYAAGVSVIISYPDIFVAEALVNTALEQGAVLAAPLTYTINEREALEVKVRDEAIKDAETKAKDVAKSFNKQVGKMLAYTETPAQNSQTTESSSTKQPGKITISTAVQVSFQTK